MKTIEQAYNEWFKKKFGRLSEYDELTQEEVDLCAKKWDELSDNFEVHSDLQYDSKREELLLIGR